MSLKEMTHKLFADNEDHFVIDDGEGQFKVAKYMIDEPTLKRIEAMERHEGFACGGVVKAADGIEVPQPEEVPFMQRLGQGIKENLIDPTKDALGAYGKIGSEAANIGNQFTQGLKEPEVGYTPPEYKVPETPTPLVPKAVPEEKAPAQPTQPAPSYQVPATPTPLLNASQRFENDVAETRAAYEADYRSKVNAATGIAKANVQFVKDLNNFQTRIDTYTNHFNDEQKALEEGILSTKINPNEIFERPGTGNKLLATIATFLGGIGASSTGGKNLALEQINKTIDQDIDAQKANLSNKQSLYSRNLEKYKNQMVAYEATKSMMIAAAKAQMTGIELQNSGPGFKLAAQNGKMQLDTLLQSRNQEQAKFLANSALDAGQLTKDQLQYLAPEKRKEAMRLPGTEEKYGSPVGIAPDKLNESLVTNQNAIDAVTNLKNFLKEGPSQPWQFKKGEKGEGVLSRASIALIDEYIKQGNTKEQATKMVDRMLENPSSWGNRTGFSAPDKLDDTINDLQSRKDNELQRYLPGYKKTIPSKAKDKK